MCASVLLDLFTLKLLISFLLNHIALKRVRNEMAVRLGDPVLIFGAKQERVLKRHIAEKPLKTGIVEHLVRDVGFSQLPMQHGLFHRSRGDHAIHADLALLPDSPSPLPGLLVRYRVPVRIKNDNSICSSQVDAKPADLRRQQRNKNAVVLVKCVNQQRTVLRRRASIHANVLVALLLGHVLKDIEHHACLGEDQHLVLITLPALEEIAQRLELRRPLIVNWIV